MRNSSEAPLTDREKLLLERLDRLEQRLAAMEAKEASGATPAAAGRYPGPTRAGCSTGQDQRANGGSDSACTRSTSQRRRRLDCRPGQARPRRFT